MIEREGVPGEASAHAEGGRNTFEHLAAVGPRWQVQERAKRTVDQRSRLSEGQVAHIPFVQLKLDARLGRTLACLLEHPRGGVDSHHLAAGRAGNRNRNPAISYCELDERPVSFTRKLRVEANVRGHLRRPLV